MRRRRPKLWLIQPAEDGLVDVLYGGRALARSISPYSAQYMIRGRRKSDEKVLQEEKDGYRVDVTRQV
jgi:hypothetical protein